MKYCTYLTAIYYLLWASELKVLRAKSNYCKCLFFLQAVIGMRNWTHILYTKEC